MTHRPTNPAAQNFNRISAPPATGPDQAFPDAAGHEGPLAAPLISTADAMRAGLIGQTPPTPYPHLPARRRAGVLARQERSHTTGLGDPDEVTKIVYGSGRPAPGDNSPTIIPGTILASDYDHDRPRLRIWPYAVMTAVGGTAVGGAVLAYMAMR